MSFCQITGIVTDIDCVIVNLKGYFLLPNFYGKGNHDCLSEATNPFCLAVDIIDRSCCLFASIWDSNPASGRILEKCGFNQCHSGTMAKKDRRDCSFQKIPVV